MKAVSLQEMYRSANENTAAIWGQNAGTGERREGNYYDPTKLALAAGIQPSLSFSVTHLICELHKLAQDDPLADILPAQAFHFTFLPVTLPLYNLNDPLPAKVGELINIWAEYQAKNIVISHLRLVALPSQLLLAGIPDNAAIAMRQSFCEKVLGSQWKNELLMRHTRSPLPAPFWHGTLLRYSAAFLPEILRQFFYQRQTIDFGNAAGELTLAKVNYNWTTCYPLKN